MSTLLAILTIAYTVTPAVLPVVAGSCEERQGVDRQVRYERLVRQEIVTDANGFAHVEQVWKECK